MAKFQFEAHPGRTLHFLLFEHVKNCSGLLQQLLDGSLQPELALLNAALVVDTFPLLGAAHKALTAQARGALKTRTLHSELVYNYAASKHIRESLKKWGISADTSYVLVARFDATPEQLEAIRKLMIGTEIQLSELKLRADLASIKQLYKIQAEELQISPIEDAMASRIACRDSL